MLVLLAAATVAAAQAAPDVKVYRGPDAHARAETVCKADGAIETHWSDPALLYRHGARVARQRLGDLPKANHEKAVLRTVGGCSAPLVVGYGVGR